MSYEEIKERVSWGEEFYFCYNGEEYWISQTKYKLYLTRVRGSVTQEFSSTEELFQNGKVEGKSLVEIWEDIRQYF